jgi:hypothetical protein
MRGPAILLAALLLGGCAAGGPPNVAQLPPGAFGAAPDPDQAALNRAEYDFADSSRLYGRPAEAARAAAAIDYLAGAFDTQPRWAYLPPDTKQEMQDARAGVRQALGIAPDAPSQGVVDALFTAADALDAGDRAAAVAALRAPGFTLPPGRMLTRLSEMPYVQAANVATREASDSTQEVPRPDCAQCVSAPLL